MMAAADGTEPENPPNQSLGERVGARVRKARRLSGMSRRVLSENSDVSPRYLAQLETGEGNISIGLLQRVANALECRIEWLIGEDDPWDTDSLQILERYREASEEVREQVRDALRIDSASARRAGRICLIGLRGAGKSTLGKLLAEKLDLPFVELTDVIEKSAGMPLSEIMAFYGQEGYRELEAQALDQVSTAQDRLVLAVAGGIVAEPETFDTLLNQFHTIWLRASPVEHMVRVQAQGDRRPMVGNPEAMDQLKSILASREAQYSRATEQLDTSGQTLETSLQQVQQLVMDRNLLNQT